MFSITITLLVSILVLFCEIPTSTSFLIRKHEHQLSRIQPLYLSDELPLLGEENVCLEPEETICVFDSLRERKEALENGVGRRYVCRTQKGFLNVHKEPGDPFNTMNIVNQLEEGDIVISSGPPRGVGGWIPHDHGGWSVTKYNGFVFLERTDE